MVVNENEEGELQFAPGPVTAMLMNLPPKLRARVLPANAARAANAANVRNAANAARAVNTDFVRDEEARNHRRSSRQTRRTDRDLMLHQPRLRLGGRRLDIKKMLHGLPTMFKILLLMAIMSIAPRLDSNNLVPPPSPVPKAEFMEHALLRIAGKGWQLVDFSDRSFRSELNYECEFVPFQSTKGKVVDMCVHTKKDIVSDAIREKKRWKDCDALPDLWEEKSSDSDGENGLTKKTYVEIGANIGSCVVEMLLSTNANIVAFEPHPMNQFCLHQTLARLGPEYQRRVALVPVALGGQQDVSQIYTGEGNMGNSVVGRAIKDFPEQSIRAPVDIWVERLDNILSDKIIIPLVKMDAQGFECQILDGMSQSLADHIRTIKFEMASQWLQQQNCLDLLPRFRRLNFTITSGGGKVVDADNYNCGICDLYALGQ